MNTLQVVLSVVPALILFLYGIENFSKEVRALGGDRFRNFLKKVTKTPVSGSFFGAIVTGIIQSSSATTVITISLVNAGMISFTQSLGIIFGSNVGTTLTAQLVALKLTAFAPVFIIIGFLVDLGLIGKKYKIFGKPLFFFGLVFFGLMLVSYGIEPIKNDPQVIEFFASFSNIFVALLVGFVFTALVQSSSVTTGLVVVLAQSDLIDLHIGLPLLIGANIGSSTTALLASFNMNLHAKRAGVSNFLFNLGGGVLFLPFIGLFLSLIASLGGNVAQQVANAHLVFNIVTLVLFLIILKPFSKLIIKIVRGEEEEILFNTKYLKDDLPKDNDSAIDLINEEISYSLEITEKIFDKSIDMFKKPDKQGFDYIEKLESLNDFLDDKITEAVLNISNRKLTKNQAQKGVLLVQMSNAIEQLGDLGEDLSILSKRNFERGTHIEFELIESVNHVFLEFKKNNTLIKNNYPVLNEKTIQNIKKREKTITQTINKKYEQHLQKLNKNKKYQGSIFVEAIAILESASSKQRDIRKYIEQYNKL